MVVAVILVIIVINIVSHFVVILLIENVTEPRVVIPVPEGVAPIIVVVIIIVMEFLLLPNFSADITTALGEILLSR